MKILDYFKTISTQCSHNWKLIISSCIYISTILITVLYFIFYDTVYVIMKPLPAFMLSLHFILYDPHIVTFLMSIAYIFYGGGDILTAFGVEYKKEYLSGLGILSFSFGHIISIISLYINHCKLNGSMFKKLFNKGTLTPYIFIILFVSCVVGTAMKNIGLIIGFACYYTLIVFVCWVYLSKGLMGKNKINYVLVVLGYHMFLISDTIISVEKYVIPIDNKLFRAVLVLSTYWIALLCIGGLFPQKKKLKDFHCVINDR